MKSLSPESFTIFGDLLRYLRQREKLTQRELSIAVGYSESQINRLEHNLRLPESSIVAAQFVPALHLEDEPDVAARLIELAAQARGEPRPASLTFPDSAPLREPRTNLPAQMTSFIGREDEIAELTARARTTRMLTLTGAGGCGKTRLTLEVAAQFVGATVLRPAQNAVAPTTTTCDFRDGVWLIEFAPLSDASLVPRAVANVFGLADQPNASPTHVLTNYLASKRMLLIFDNCEHLVGACAELAEQLLRVCPNIHLLATSREVLRIAGEVNWRVPSLTTPDPAHLPALEQLLNYEAVRLFVERAHAVQSGFDITSGNAAAIAQICHQLDGIPLAIELAAARVNALSAEQIAQRLDDRFGLLTSGSRTALPRHQTLRATIAWSVDLLTPPERELFARLSVFAGGFTAEAACSVTGAEGQGLSGGDSALSRQSSTLDLLSNLVDKSLVIADVRGQAARYRLLETIRQYADEQLRAFDVDDEQALRRRHLDFYLALAEEAEPKLRGSEAGQWLKQLDAEHDNLRAAIRWAFDDGKMTNTSALRLVAALNEFWQSRGYFRERQEQLLKALAKSDPSERTPARAKMLNVAALANWQARHFDEAHALLEEALSIGIELGDRRNIAQSFQYLCYEAISQKDYSAARSYAEKALALFRELGDKLLTAIMHSHLADIARHQRDYDRARGLYEGAIALFAKEGDDSGTATSLRRMGRVVLYQGDPMKALELCKQSLELHMDVENQHEAMSCLALFAGVAVA